MSEDNESMEVRTAAEESLVAVLAEACYIDGGTPKEFRELIEKDPALSRLYNKEPHIFKGRHSSEDAFKESIDAYF